MLLPYIRCNSFKHKFSLLFSSRAIWLISTCSSSPSSRCLSTTIMLLINNISPLILYLQILMDLNIIHLSRIMPAWAGQARLLKEILVVCFLITMLDILNQVYSKLPMVNRPFKLPLLTAQIYFKRSLCLASSRPNSHYRARVKARTIFSNNSRPMKMWINWHLQARTISVRCLFLSQLFEVTICNRWFRVL